MPWRSPKRHKVSDIEQSPGVTNDSTIIPRARESKEIKLKEYQKRPKRKHHHHSLFHFNRRTNDGSVTVLSPNNTGSSHDKSGFIMTSEIETQMSYYNIPTIRGKVLGTQQYVFDDCDQTEDNIDPFDDYSDGVNNKYREIVFKNEFVPDLPPLFADDDDKEDDEDMEKNDCTLVVESPSNTITGKLRRFFSLRNKNPGKSEENRILDFETHDEITGSNNHKNFENEGRKVLCQGSPIILNGEKAITENPFSDTQKEVKTPTRSWHISSLFKTPQTKRKESAQESYKESSEDDIYYKGTNSGSCMDQIDPFISYQDPSADISEVHTDDDDPPAEEPKTKRSWFSTWFGTSQRKLKHQEDQMGLNEILTGTALEVQSSSSTETTDTKSPESHYEHSISIDDSEMRVDRSSKSADQSSSSADVNHPVDVHDTPREQANSDSIPPMNNVFISTDGNLPPVSSNVCNTEILSPSETVESTKSSQSNDIEETESGRIENRIHYTELSILKVPEDTIILQQSWNLWKAEMKQGKPNKASDKSKGKLWFRNLGIIENEKYFGDYIRLCDFNEVAKGNEYRLYREYLIPSRISSLMHKSKKIQIKVPMYHSFEFWYFLAKIVLTRDLEFSNPRVQIDTLIWKKNFGVTSSLFSIYLNVNKYDRATAREVMDELASFMPHQFRLILENAKLSNGNLKTEYIYSPPTLEYT